jgi:hypothetical protein
MDHEKFYNQLKSYLELKVQRPFTKTKITLLIANSLKFASQATNLTEEQVKDIVLKAIKDIVSESSKIDADDKDSIIALIDLIGSDLFDTLVELARDTYTFIKKKIQSCRNRKSTRKVSSFSRAEMGTLGRNEEEFDALKAYLELKIQRPFNAGKIVGVIAAGIKFIEEFRHLSGVEKKNLVIHALREVVSSSTRLSETEKDDILELIDLFADDFIDVAVMFGKEKIELFQQKGCRGLFRF